MDPFQKVMIGGPGWVLAEVIWRRLGFGGLRVRGREVGLHWKVAQLNNSHCLCHWGWLGAAPSYCLVWQATLP